MKWWMWNLIGRQPIECLYQIVIQDLDRQLNAILAEAIERWLESAPS